MHTYLSVYRLHGLSHSLFTDKEADSEHRLALQLVRDGAVWWNPRATLSPLTYANTFPVFCTLNSGTSSKPLPTLHGSPQGRERAGALPGRTFRKSLFHTVSLMSAWWRPGLKEMGLKAPSRGRACWSSALRATVLCDGGDAQRAPQPFTHGQVQPASHSSGHCALKMPIISSPPPHSQRPWHQWFSKGEPGGLSEMHISWGPIPDLRSQKVTTWAQ